MILFVCKILQWTENSSVGPYEMMIKKQQHKNSTGKRERESIRQKNSKVHIVVPIHELFHF